MKIGIVGHEKAKFTPETELKAKDRIILIIDEAANDCENNIADVTVVSGRCHLGGVDTWAEEIADRLGLKKEIYPPKFLNWSHGYKPRNISIATKSDIVHNIVVESYPESYTGMKFKLCYHCGNLRPPHVKSGGCWTAKLAQSLGKQAIWHII